MTGMDDGLYLVFNGVAPRLLERLGNAVWDRRGVTAVGCTVRDRETARWLKKESPVRYEPLHVAEDVRSAQFPTEPDPDRVRMLEETYGRPSGYPYLLADDRHISATHDEQQRIFQGWFDFYERVFEQFDPDLLLTNIVDDTYAMVPYEVAQHYGGRALWWKGTRVGNRYSVLEDTLLDDLTAVHRLFEAFRDGRCSPDEFADAESMARSYREEFEGEGVKPGYFERRERTFRSTFEMGIRSLRSSVMRESSNFGPSDVSKSIADIFRRSYAAARYWNTPDTDEPFVFFPLHAQPEPSTGILAPMFLNQVSLVEQVSRSLPMNYKLYVKEHPRMFRDSPRTIATYRTIQALPNTHLVDVAADSHSLIKASDAVVTVTGTPAFEAVLYETPSITTGDAHFNELSMVSNCRTLERLATVVDRKLSSSHHNERELHEYLTALFARSVGLPSDLFGLSEEEQVRSAELLYPLLVRELDR
jgi:hypothetical protein